MRRGNTLSSYVEILFSISSSVVLGVGDYTSVGLPSKGTPSLDSALKWALHHHNPLFLGMQAQTICYWSVAFPTLQVVESRWQDICASTHPFHFYNISHLLSPPSHPCWLPLHFSFPLSFFPPKHIWKKRCAKIYIDVSSYTRKPIYYQSLINTYRTSWWKRHYFLSVLQKFTAS